VNPLVEESGVADYIDYGNGYEYEEGQFDNGQFTNNGNGNSGNGNDIAEYENGNDIAEYESQGQDEEEYEYYDDDEFYEEGEYEYYDDEEYEDDKEYVQDYERDYQDHKNQVDTAYGLDGSPCSPEGKLTVNPNDCSSFLMCNHKKYMVRPCQDGLLWDPQYNICNRADSIQQKPQCKLLDHKGSVSLSIEKLQAKKSTSKKKMAAMKKLGKNSKFLAKKTKTGSIFSQSRPAAQKRPQPRVESRPLSRSDSGPNLDFKFFKPLF